MKGIFFKSLKKFRIQNVLRHQFLLGSHSNDLLTMICWNTWINFYASMFSFAGFGFFIIMGMLFKTERIIKITGLSYCSKLIRANDILAGRNIESNQIIKKDIKDQAEFKMQERNVSDVTFSRFSKLTSKLCFQPIFGV